VRPVFEQLKKIDENKIDFDYLRSEKFAEFFMQGLEQASRSTTKR
jgi:hypothetical protein